MNKTPANPSTVKALLSNPAVRRVILRTTRKAVGTATTAMANRKAARSPEPQAGPESPKSTPMPGAVLEREALSGFVSQVAKPMAQKMAEHPTGRTVLEALNKISGDALGVSGRKSDPINSFVTRLAGAAAAASSAAKTPQPEQPAKVNFTPLQPTVAPGTEPAKVVKWPPPKSSTGSGTGSAPE